MSGVIQNEISEKTLKGSYDKQALTNIGKDTLLYLPGRLAPVLSSIIGLVIFTRILNPTEYGQYILILNLLGFIATIAYNWIGSSAFRYYEEHKINKSLPTYKSTLFLSHLSVSLILGVLGIFGYLLLHNRYINKFGDITFWILVGLLWLDSFVEISLNVARANREVAKYSMASIVHSALKIIFAAIAITFLSLGVKGIFGGYLLASFMIGLFFLISFLKKFDISIGRISVSLVKSFASYGFPAAGACLCTWVLSVADRYIIQILKGSEMVGIYSAGYQIAGNIILLPSSLIMLAAFTIIIQVYERRIPGEIESLLEKLTAIYIVLGLPLVLIVGIFSRPIVKIFLGKDFYAASNILALIALGQFSLSLAEYFEKSFQLTKRTSNMLFFVITVAVSNVVLNFLLIPSMNEIGAALATFLSYLLYLIFLGIYSRKFLAWRFPYKTLLKCSAAGVACIVLFLNVPASVEVGNSYILTFLMVASLLLSYFFLLLIIGEEIVRKIGRTAFNLVTRL